MKFTYLQSDALLSANSWDQCLVRLVDVSAGVVVVEVYMEIQEPVANGRHELSPAKWVPQPAFWLLEELLDL